MGNEGSKPLSEHNNNNKKDPKKVLLEPVEKFLVEPAKEFSEQAKTYLDGINDKRKALRQKVFDNQARFYAKTKEGFDFRQKLHNPPIDKQVLDFDPPEFEKSREEKLFLLDALKKNFILNHLEPTERLSVVLAFEKASFDTKTTIVKQGDTDANYYYIVYSGFCEFRVNDAVVGSCASGDGFGELALLYSCPRAASVITTAPTVCFRIDKQTFRCLIMSQKQRADSDKIDLLRNVPFLKDADRATLQRVTPHMVLKTYKKGDYLTRKGDLVGNSIDIIYKGEVIATDFQTGAGLNAENLTFGAGDHYGERAIMDPTAKRLCNVVALSDEVSIYDIDRKTFQAVFGDLSHLMLRSRDKLILENVGCLKNTFLEESTFHILSNLIEDQTFSAGTYVMTEGKITEPAFYIIRSGKCRRFKRSNNNNEQQQEAAEATLGSFGTFGQDHLTMDVGKTKLLLGVDFQFVAGYSVFAEEETVCGVLKLKDCRSVFDTTLIGEGKPKRKSQMVYESMKLDDLMRHTILGQGSFGQVWLVSANKPNTTTATTTTTTLASLNDRVPFALKIQSKYDLIRCNMAASVVQECEIMSQLQHPFLMPLVKTYQDTDFIYMLLSILQGGELSHRIYEYPTEAGIPETHARFYAACVVEALSFMHQKRMVHRDLKPENIMLDSHGYPVMIDFGFAKHVPDKTYTFCGTPLYVAPEVVLQKGHTTSADNWSFGCIVYEMLAGRTPFYEPHMEQMDLYKAICTGRFAIEPVLRYKQPFDLINKLFVVQPSMRLGSMARGQMDILRHPWFYEINFALLRRKEHKDVPWEPKVQNILDASNFTDCSHLQDRTTEKRPRLEEEQQELFELFGVL